MTAVRVSPEAVRDLDEIWFHIAKDSPKHADRFLDRLLHSATATLAAAPLAGRARPELSSGLRSWPFERYVIFYRIRRGAVEIARVIHGARDLDSIFRRNP